MKLLILIFSLLIPTVLLGQTLDEILERHFEAIGIEHLNKVESIQYLGVYKNHFVKKISKDVSTKLFSPDVEITVAKQEGYLLRIFDREEPTTSGYFLGQAWRDQQGYPPEKWNPNDYDRIQIQLYIDIEGFLYNWGIKGIRLEHLPDIKLNNQFYYRIKVTTSEKDLLYYYINKKNDLLEKISFQGDLSENGDDINSITFSDYRNVKGVKFAFNRMYNSRMIDGSMGKREVIFRKIELNVKVDPNIFQLESRL